MTFTHSQAHSRGSIGFYIIVLLLCIGAYGWFHGFYFTTTAAERADMPPNMPALLQPPVQESPLQPLTISMRDATLQKVVAYTVTARILGRSDYHFGWESDFAPVDLALGWGLMADKRVLAKLSISQSGRFYHWSAREYPLPPEQITASSANTHIIPANDRIKKIIKGLHKNQIVTLKGSLVNIARPDSTYWNTSTTRQDDGDGACELMYVEDVTIY